MPRKSSSFFAGEWSGVYAIQRLVLRLQAHGPRVGACAIQRLGLGLPAHGPRVRYTACRV